MLQDKQQVCCFVSVSRSPEDFVFILAEGLQPGTNVSGVAAGVVRDTLLSQQKYTGEFGSEFFSRVVEISEPVALIESLTIQTSRMTRGVRRLMKCRAVEVGCRLES